jgi:acetyl-CoA carboxylase biotin carboxyl carrier protein
MNRPERSQGTSSKGRGSPTAAQAPIEDESRPSPQPIVDLDFLRGLIAAVDDSGIDSLEVSRGGTRIRISKTPESTTSIVQGSAQVSNEPAHLVPAAPAAPAAAISAAPEEPAPVAPAQNNWVEIKSPMVGTFYRSPSPEAPAYVEVGSRVVKGQTLCILEAMKLMNELEADLSGIVREIAVENGEPVEYGQVLYLLEPEA